MSSNALGMLTRKQQWRRMKTRKCPPEILEAILAFESGEFGPWNHSHVVGIAQHAPRENEGDKILAEEAKNSAATDPIDSGVAVEPANILTRSISDSSLGSRRLIFSRSSSKHDLRPATSRMVHAVRRPHRKFVSFNPQVKMMLIAKSEEYRIGDKARLWWGQDDYNRFRKALIDWKQANPQRISEKDSILSIDLGGLDECNEEDAAAKAAAAKAASAAATAAGATAVAAAAAAAAASIAVEVARAEENDQAKRNGAITRKKKAEKEAAPAVNGGGGAAKSAERSYVQPRRPGADVSWEHAVVQQTMRKSAKRRPYRHIACFSVGSGSTDGSSGGDGSGCKVTPYRLSADDVGVCKVTPDWFSADDTRGMMPLRASTFDSSQRPPSPQEIHLKPVALSDLQATVESLREWRKTLDMQSTASVLGGGGGGDESRGSAVSLQQQSRSYAQRGRATPKLTVPIENGATPKLTVPVESGATLKLAVPMENGYKVAQGNFDSNGTAAAAEGEEDEKQGKLNGQESPPSSDVGATWVNPVLVAFKRQQREAKALHAELEEKERARAVAMVEAAKAEAAKAAAETEETEGVSGSEACGGKEEAGETIVQPGMDDAPDLAMAATSFDIRLATDEVSKPSLRRIDAVNIFHDLAEKSWASEPLSSSA